MQVLVCALEVDGLWVVAGARAAVQQGQRGGAWGLDAVSALGLLLWVALQHFAPPHLLPWYVEWSPASAGSHFCHKASEVIFLCDDGVRRWERVQKSRGG